MELNLSLVSDEFDKEDMHEMTLDLCGLINTETEIEARLQESGLQDGMKGDPVTVGQIILSLIGGGGVAVGLVQVLKAYIDRGRPIEIELQRKDGVKIKIKGDNVSSKNLQKTVELVREFIGGQNE